MRLVTRRRAVWALVALGVIGAIWLKVRLEAGLSLERAREHEVIKDMPLAIALYRQTVRWYSPGSAPVAEAVERLWEIGQASEAAGEREQALAAYRALRSALFGIRSLWQPYEARLEPLNERIAALMASQEGAEPGTAEHFERAAYHEALLAIDRAPSLGWSVVAVVGFLAWVGCLFGLALRGFDQDSGALVARAAAPWFGAVVVTAAAWMVSLGFA